jgi:hypothetical protein
VVEGKAIIEEIISHSSQALNLKKYNEMKYHKKNVNISYIILPVRDDADRNSIHVCINQLIKKALSKTIEVKSMTHLAKKALAQT